MAKNTDSAGRQGPALALWPPWGWSGWDHRSYSYDGVVAHLLPWWIHIWKFLFEEVNNWAFCDFLLLGWGGGQGNGVCFCGLCMWAVLWCYVDFPVAQMVKNLPAMQETCVWSLGWEVPLEKGMTIHSSILAWRIPWTEKPGGYSPWGHKESDTTERLTHTHTHMLLCAHIKIHIFSLAGTYLPISVP